MAKQQAKNQAAAAGDQTPTGGAAAADSGAAAAAGDTQAGGDQATQQPQTQQPPVQQPPARSVDPAVAAAAAAAGLDVDGLDDEEIQELLAAAKADQARSGAGAATAPNGRVLVREANGRTDRHAIALMLEACDIYGVDPAADKRPQELLAWKFYAGQDDPTRGVGPDAVVIVTAGGAKLKHYDDPDVDMDPETVDRLRRIFGLFRQDPKTKEVTVLNLPADLTLPASAVNGVGTTDHQYQGSYLKLGGKKAAADKEARRQARMKAQGLV